GFPEDIITKIEDFSGRKVLALQGRFHFYEGNTMEVVTFPVRIMRALACHSVLVTNAAGGIGYGPGTLMLIKDHINMIGTNPLIGENLEEFGPRFPDMSDAYTATYRQKAHQIAEKQNIKLEEGVYLGVSGPTYETPAEIRAFQTMGAQAAATNSNIIRNDWPEFDFPQIADFKLLDKAYHIAKEMDITTHVGSVLSSDGFYSNQQDRNMALGKLGVHAIEMEAAALYYLAAQHNVNALAMMTISDNLNNPEEDTSAEERQTTFTDMMKVGLETLISE
ncbi:purine nucleoside phosphorylase, partial [Streptococcus agalactiae STIR-CD-17]